MQGRHPSVAVMFVDISGSTSLYEALGDTQAHARVDARLQQLARLSAEHGGRLVKSAGDGALYSFAGTDQAMLAATAMFETIATERQVDASALGVHAGCHFGPVIESTGDLFGDTVNLASRVAGLARSGQIILTDAAVAQLPSGMAIRARPLNRVTVRGKKDDVGIWEYLWQDAPDLTMLSTRPGGRRGARLLLRYAGTEKILTLTEQTEATFGREPGCDFIIDHQRTSRSHARVELRMDKFVIVDHSSNGTWVSIGNEAPIVLRREELILRGAGAITFGRTPDDAEAARVEFEVL